MVELFEHREPLTQLLSLVPIQPESLCNLGIEQRMGLDVAPGPLFRSVGLGWRHDAIDQDRFHIRGELLFGMSSCGEAAGARGLREVHRIKLRQNQSPESRARNGPQVVNTYALVFRELEVCRTRLQSLQERGRK